MVTAFVQAFCKVGEPSHQQRLRRLRSGQVNWPIGRNKRLNESGCLDVLANSQLHSHFIGGYHAPLKHHHMISGAVR